MEKWSLTLGDQDGGTLSAFQITDIAGDEFEIPTDQIGVLWTRRNKNVARMIPPVIPVSCPSPGEREIFTCLRDEPGTKDWIVLHSLDIAHHLRQVVGGRQTL